MYETNIRSMRHFSSQASSLANRSYLVATSRSRLGANLVWPPSWTSITMMSRRQVLRWGCNFFGEGEARHFRSLSTTSISALVCNSRKLYGRKGGTPPWDHSEVHSGCEKTNRARFQISFPCVYDRHFPPTTACDTVQHLCAIDHPPGRTHNNTQLYLADIGTEPIINGPNRGTFENHSGTRLPLHGRRKRGNKPLEPIRSTQQVKKHQNRIHRSIWLSWLTQALEFFTKQNHKPNQEPKPSQAPSTRDTEFHLSHEFWPNGLYWPFISSDYIFVLSIAPSDVFRAETYPCIFTLSIPIMRPKGQNEQVGPENSRDPPPSFWRRKIKHYCTAKTSKSFRKGVVDEEWLAHAWNSPKNEETDLFLPFFNKFFSSTSRTRGKIRQNSR